MFEDIEKMFSFGNSLRKRQSDENIYGNKYMMHSKISELFDVLKTECAAKNVDGVEAAIHHLSFVIKGICKEGNTVVQTVIDCRAYELINKLKEWFENYKLQIYEDKGFADKCFDKIVLKVKIIETIISQNFEKPLIKDSINEFNSTKFGNNKLVTSFQNTK